MSIIIYHHDEIGKIFYNIFHLFKHVYCLIKIRRQQIFLITIKDQSYELPYIYIYIPRDYEIFKINSLFLKLMKNYEVEKKELLNRSKGSTKVRVNTKDTTQTEKDE